MHDLALSSFGLSAGAGSACLLGLSLCSGAGGLDLGLAIACPGYRAMGYVERDAYAAAILVARMEDAALDHAPVWDDIATFDGRPWRGTMDIVTAGYPCQPFSVAGKRRGTDDPRHLWPHVARIIGECKPSFVFLENVAHHLRLGFPEVATGLVDMGYRLAAGLFTAAEVGAPHRRERLFILAHCEGDDLANPARLLRDPLERRQPRGDDAVVANAADRQFPLSRWRTKARERFGRSGAGLADTDGQRRLQTECWQPENGRPDPCSRNMDDADGSRSQGWSNESCQHAGERTAWPPGPHNADGWQRYLRAAPDLEPAVRRGADGLAHRVDRLRLCGNGVVPLVAAHALRTLAAELLVDD